MNLYTNQKKEIKIRWHKPPLKWFKLKIDGAFDCKSNIGGIAGLFRDHNGDWITGYGCKCFANSPLHAELLALDHGLQVAINRNLQPLEIEIDSTDVIKALSIGNDTYSSLISSCRWLLSQLQNILIRHSFREGNHAAHLLAKEASKMSHLNVRKNYAISPTSVVHQLSLDKSSTMF
ncbi:uncharacterized protein LOC132047681 [Lycium ferocissimum]|uniref:uncharacterized protein LOC132047681 n=1 Tax=Lycium ferocissimum TaxID=112874 RepID=UPI00281595CC|nr:uncharacterized protein LOC132047681 [Lycium ferocissimum]